MKLPTFDHNSVEATMSLFQSLSLTFSSLILFLDQCSLQASLLDFTLSITLRGGDHYHPHSINIPIVTLSLSLPCYKLGVIVLS